MRLGPFEIRFVKGATAQTLPQPARARPWDFGWQSIVESFPGAWQRGEVVPDPTSELVKHAPVFSCVSLISGDVGRMEPRLQRRVAGAWLDDELDTPSARVLRRPNHFQNWQTFIENWVTCRLLWGNTYILKSRDADGAVESLHILDPQLVRVIVAGGGAGVYYSVSTDHLHGIDGQITLRASEVVHDRAHALFHPLVGLSALSAAAISGTFGALIAKQSAHFFKNASRPSGHLTSDHEIDDETASRLKRDFEAGFSGSMLGRLLVSGSGLSYQPMTIPPADAQLAEQLKLAAEDVARAFKVPSYKIGAGNLPSVGNIAQLQADYLGQALHPTIQAIELGLGEALELPIRQRVHLDASALLRMDAISRAEVTAKLVTCGVLSPNEARAQEGLPPVRGGEQPLAQQQMWTLGQLAGRTPPADAPAKGFDGGGSSSPAPGQ